MAPKPGIWWVRQDLRLDDNPALIAAIERGGPVIPVFIWSPREEGQWAPGPNSRWWLRASLHSLSAELREVGSRLILRSGNTREELSALLKVTGARDVFWNRRYEPEVVKRDLRVKQKLLDAGVDVGDFEANLLFEPGAIRNKAGRPVQVFTPFWKACCALPEPPASLPRPTRLRRPRTWPESLKLADLGLEKGVTPPATVARAWRPGSTAAHEQLARFLSEALTTYDEDRDRPDLEGTSRLSPHLHFGEISPRSVWHAVHLRGRRSRSRRLRSSAEVFLRELGWREFAHHLLVHFPRTPDEPLRPEFEGFPWRDDERVVEAWRRGETGYPFVDAGLHELRRTGWMHNRVRMVVGSFLVKDLLIPWQVGARWFWDTLVDANLANNTLGWQWVGGCGADAAPYFRIFNPVTQGRRFDPHGSYVRRWVPELSELPDQWIHAPGSAPAAILADARVKLGRTYPHPVVDHAQARQRALAAFQTLKRRR